MSHPGSIAALGFSLMLTFISCEKTYPCQCTTEDKRTGEKSVATGGTVTGSTKKRAERVCTNGSKDTDSHQVICEIK